MDHKQYTRIGNAEKLLLDECEVAAAYDTFVGAQAGALDITGTNNAFYGFSDGISNTTGHDNTFLGGRASCPDRGG
jgi:hypothetical protein